MKNKLLKRIEIENIGSMFDVENVTDIINYLKNKQLEYEAKGFLNIKLCFEWGGYDSPYVLCFFGDRYETDEEYQKRLVLEQKEKEKKRLANDKKLLKLQKEARSMGYTLVTNKK